MTESSIPAPELDSNIPWGGVTNPEEHDPQHFRYLIHLDSGRSNSLDPSNPLHDEVWEYILEKPEKISELRLVSASLVDQSHRVLFQGTSSNHGFIIEAPQTAIIAANHDDMGSTSKTEEELRRQFPVPNPDELMAQTKPTHWNEVALSPDGIAIKAIFWVESLRCCRNVTPRRI